jgi:hypothetical protein
MYGIRKGFQNTQPWSHEEDIEGLVQERLVHMLSPIGGHTYCLGKGGFPFMPPSRGDNRYVIETRASLVG